MYFHIVFMSNVLYFFIYSIHMYTICLSPSTRKTFSKEELLQFHIFSMIGLEMRYAFSSNKFGHPIQSAIYISDMKG